jgi:wobble nucleotide-excising tRNase
MKPCDECVKEYYEKMYRFIQYIAKDYIELSHEKVRIQRDDYVREARELLKQINEYE